MGELLKVIGAARQAKQSLNAAGVGGGGPGAQPIQLPGMPSLYTPAADFSGQGMQSGTAQDTSQMGGVQPSPVPVEAPVASAQPLPPTPLGNPYADVNPYEGPKEVAESLQPEGEEVVEGDRFTPKKENPLGRIMDTLLELRGRRPVFKDRTDQANLKEAMKGVNEKDDPSMLINRVKKFNPELAMALEEKMAVRNRLQGNLDRQNNVFDLKLEETVRDRAASMMGAVNPNDKDAVKKMRQRVLGYASKKGFDFSAELPEDMDGFDFNAFRLGEIPVLQQEKLGQGERRLDQQDRGLNIRQEGVDDTKEYRQERLEDFDQQEAGRNRRNATNEQGRRDRAAQKGGGVSPVITEALRGMGVPEEKLQKPSEGYKLILPQGGILRQKGKWHIFERQPDGKLKKVRSY